MTEYSAAAWRVQARAEASNPAVRDTALRAALRAHDLLIRRLDRWPGFDAAGDDPCAALRTAHDQLRAIATVFGCGNPDGTACTCPALITNAILSLRDEINAQVRALPGQPAVPWPMTISGPALP